MRTTNDAAAVAGNVTVTMAAADADAVAAAEVLADQQLQGAKLMQLGLQLCLDCLRQALEGHEHTALQATV